jgi:hypothetical protein
MFFPDVLQAAAGPDSEMKIMFLNNDNSSFSFAIVNENG